MTDAADAFIALLPVCLARAAERVLAPKDRWARLHSLWARLRRRSGECARASKGGDAGAPANIGVARALRRHTDLTDTDGVCFLPLCPTLASSCKYLRA